MISRTGDLVHLNVATFFEMAGFMKYLLLSAPLRSRNRRCRGAAAQWENRLAICVFHPTICTP
jgi:hypothetical protein